ncbi:recombinase family protein [Planctomicrobium piriforme]|uniref:Site-specific DNA recombinase n=1 Tax=Planctomicrobium piriforme TaxID=1576369 RepID=A0A1I3KCN5_9PLAN|nr:recombinase family protein [Planctomicrobium piriforme]SFI70252.1 Site-specific DNA recombinase [Planctomicrobium piriforme]
MPNIIAYYRVSTKQQGQSGLGLDGQRSAVREFAERQGATILRDYTEVESGKKSDRIELLKAIGHAKLAKATLVVAKLDRLSRNVAFLSSLMESGVDFVACDNPNANRLTVHILAAVAEDEAQRISDRTKAALAAAKARGVKLGSARDGHWAGREDRRGWQEATKAAAIARTKAATDAYSFLIPTIQEMREQGASYQAIAGRLNSDGHFTSAGKQWTATAVWRVTSH